MNPFPLVAPAEPSPGPDWEAPSPSGPPDREPIDPLNVPPPGQDVILPGKGEPIGIPSAPCPDIPATPTPPELNVAALRGNFLERQRFARGADGQRERSLDPGRVISIPSGAARF